MQRPEDVVLLRSYEDTGAILEVRGASWATPRDAGDGGEIHVILGIKAGLGNRNEDNSVLPPGSKISHLKYYYIYLLGL